MPPLTIRVVRATTCRVWSKLPTGTDTSTLFTFCNWSELDDGGKE